MNYVFHYTADAAGASYVRGNIQLSCAPLLLKSDLCSIAQVMESNGRFHGQAFRIHSIGIQSEYLPPRAPMRMIYLIENKTKG